MESGSDVRGRSFGARYAGGLTSNMVEKHAEPGMIPVGHMDGG